MYGGKMWPLSTAVGPALHHDVIAVGVSEWVRGGERLRREG